MPEAVLRIITIDMSKLTDSTDGMICVTPRPEIRVRKADSIRPAIFVGIHAVLKRHESEKGESDDIVTDMISRFFSKNDNVRSALANIACFAINSARPSCRDLITDDNKTDERLRTLHKNPILRDLLNACGITLEEHRMVFALQIELYPVRDACVSVERDSFLDKRAKAHGFTDGANDFARLQARSLVFNIITSNRKAFVYLNETEAINTDTRPLISVKELFEVIDKKLRHFYPCDESIPKNPFSTEHDTHENIDTEVDLIEYSSRFSARHIMFVNEWW